MSGKECVVLLSGGMDSGVLLAWAAQRFERVHALGFDYGSKHNEVELAHAEKLAQKYRAGFRIIRLPFINDAFSSSLLKSGAEVPDGSYNNSDMRSTVVPFRNGIMLSIAIGYAENLGIADVLIAAHAGDHPVYPDCRPEFVSAMSQAATAGTYACVRVSAPFVDIGKAAIADIGRELSFDFSMTWSCYKGGKLHCGTCATCVERKAALGFVKGTDPTRYAK